MCCKEITGLVGTVHICKVSFMLNLKGFSHISKTAQMKQSSKNTICNQGIFKN